MPNILTVLADNPLLMEAVRDLIERQFAVDDLKTDMSDADIGQRVRARLEGMKKVTAALKEIETYKTTAIQKRTENPAR